MQLSIDVCTGKACRIRQRQSASHRVAGKGDIGSSGMRQDGGEVQVYCTTIRGRWCFLPGIMWFTLGRWRLPQDVTAPPPSATLPRLPFFA